MIKKIGIGLCLVVCLLLTGCGKYGEKDIIKDFTKKIESSKGYHLTGTLQIMNNEDQHEYEVAVSYEADDKFRVSLKNKHNNHEQIILKNEDGVYVLTPSLNKSFKFQSDWPYNNSQSYLLQNIVDDLTNDKDYTFQETDDGYIFTTTVNYSSNNQLVNQNIYLDKKLNLLKVEVLDESNQAQIIMEFDDIDLKATYAKSYFTLKENMMLSEDDEVIESTSKLEDIIYPMYIPTNTRLTSQDVVSIDDGERIILTFDGDKPFTLLQETTVRSDEMTIIPVDGDPVLMAGGIAALTDSTITWFSNGVEYYLVSATLNDEELLSVAKSLSVLPVSK